MLRQTINRIGADFPRNIRFLEQTSDGFVGFRFWMSCYSLAPSR
jgi:hypothetical protein